MNSPGVEAMLEEANVAVLATVDTKGRAHAAPSGICTKTVSS